MVKMMKHKFIILELILVVGVLSFIYFAYPKAVVNVEDDFVKFSSINANVIMISENPDFSNPRYLIFNETDEMGFRLKPGNYYWKPENNLIKGFQGEFVIDSEVGLDKVNDSLVNVGNVKLNVSKAEDGTMVGHIILEPEEVKEIEDKGEYIARQDE